MAVVHIIIGAFQQAAARGVRIAYVHVRRGRALADDFRTYTTLPPVCCATVLPPYCLRTTTSRHAFFCLLGLEREFSFSTGRQRAALQELPT